MDETLLWQTRAFIYKHFAETTRPPTVEETARELSIGANEAAALFRELHARHAIYLQPSTAEAQPPAIRMANPFSAVPTDFVVHAGGNEYFANCAWDMFGVPAALHGDATIRAALTGSDEQVEVSIRGGEVIAEGKLIVHFPLPFARWYDDLVHT